MKTSRRHQTRKTKKGKPPLLTGMALKIGVMGGASGDFPHKFLEKGRELGQAIARRGCVLITGACPGLPLAAAVGAKEAGGLVVGISPGLSLDEHIDKYQSPAESHDVLIFTGSGLMGREVLQLVEPRSYGESFNVTDGVIAVLRRASHILGSASVDLEIGMYGAHRLVFSGDLGRWNRPILRDPDFVPEADTLLVESTYGDRTHASDAAEALARVIREGAARGGALLVPAFAVSRTQELIWTIRQLEEAGRIPVLPVYIDSPMAINVSDMYCRHPEDHDLDMKLLMDEKRCPLCCKQYNLIRTPEQSKSLNGHPGPLIIISASGMATGGRILHHLKARLPDPRTTVLLVGFQAAGTRGRALQDGARELRIHGWSVPVRATVETIDGLSAHADRDDILRWLSGFKKPPRQTFVVHGEPRQSQALANTLQGRLGWNVRVARDGETVDLV